MEKIFGYLQDVLLAFKVKNSRVFLVLAAFVLGIQSIVVSLMGGNGFEDTIVSLPFGISVPVFETVSKALMLFTPFLGAHTPKIEITSVNPLIKGFLDSVIDFFKVQSIYVYTAISVAVTTGSWLIVDLMGSDGFTDIVISIPVVGSLGLWQSLLLMLSYISLNMNVHHTVTQKTSSDV